MAATQPAQPATASPRPTSRSAAGSSSGGTVFTQPVAGEFAAFSTTCPHNQCPVDAVRGDAISCPCHGSEFSIEDGSVIKGPARRGLAVQTVTVEGDQVVAT